MMRFVIITSDAGAKIVPVQKYLFRKYLPDVTPLWLNLGENKINEWCVDVHNGLCEMNLSKNIVLLLDDHLLIDRVVRSISMPYDLDRLELGTINSHHKSLQDTKVFYRRFENDTPYQVSTQPSVWNLEVLKNVLKKIDGSPWNFEVNGRCKAGIVKQPVIRVIEESAISKRRQGKINLCGMKLEDIKELIDRKLVLESDIIYGWNGDNKRTKQVYGSKYNEYYDL